MKRKLGKALFLVTLLSILFTVVKAQQNKQIRVYQNGEVIKEFPLEYIDFVDFVQQVENKGGTNYSLEKLNNKVRIVRFHHLGDVVAEYPTLSIDKMDIVDLDDDEDLPLTLNQTAAILDYKGSFILKSSVKNVIWHSSDEFVATVDANGVVEGKHVGKARITASINGRSATCDISVVPTNNSYVMPYLKWHASPKEVEDNFTQFQKGYNSTPDCYIYYTNAATYELPGYIYSFDNLNYFGLYSSQLVINDNGSSENAVEVYNWLSQYYEEKSTDEDVDFLFFDNGGQFVAAFGAIIDAESLSVLGWAAIWLAPDYTGKSIYTRSFHNRLNSEGSLFATRDSFMEVDKFIEDYYKAKKNAKAALKKAAEEAAQ